MPRISAGPHKRKLGCVDNATRASELASDHPCKFTFLVKFRGSDNITSHLRQIWAPSISISHCGLPGLHSHRTMYFLALLLALSQILCCWAIDTQILEVDLVLPQNETYPPSPIFPIIFAVPQPEPHGKLPTHDYLAGGTG